MACSTDMGDFTLPGQMRKDQSAEQLGYGSKKFDADINASCSESQRRSRLNSSRLSSECSGEGSDDWMRTQAEEEVLDRRAYRSDTQQSGESSDSRDEFPEEAVGLDSWANVYLVHDRDSGHNRVYDQTVNLAQGQVNCQRATGEKGVPQCYVPCVPGSDNIDLFPQGFLWERGCDFLLGSANTLTTPSGRVLSIQMWNTLPFIWKKELDLVLVIWVQKT